METYNDNENESTNVFEKANIVYGKTKDWISSFLGVIITIMATIVVFYVSSVKGEIDAAAVLRDVKFWILTGFAGITAIFTSYINFTSTIEQMKATKNFLKTLKYYSDKKKEVEEYYQYIPEFCSFKNKQAYECAKRDLIEDADIIYKDYVDGNVDFKNLERWQKRKLRKIRRIKIKKITQSDLLQEKSEDKLTVRLLPVSENNKKKSFLAKTTLTRLLTSFLSGFTMTLGFTLGNIVLGITFGFSIIIASVMSIVQAISYTQTELRNRYIAKADLLQEFLATKEQYVKEEDVWQKQ